MRICLKFYYFCRYLGTPKCNKIGRFCKNISLCFYVKKARIFMCEFLNPVVDKNKCYPYISCVTFFVSLLFRIICYSPFFCYSNLLKSTKQWNIWYNWYTNWFILCTVVLYVNIYIWYVARKMFQLQENLHTHNTFKGVQSSCI